MGCGPIMNAGAASLNFTLDTGVVGFSTHDIEVGLLTHVAGDWYFLIQSHG